MMERNITGWPAPFIYDKKKFVDDLLVNGSENFQRLGIFLNTLGFEVLPVKSIFFVNSLSSKNNRF